MARLVFLVYDARSGSTLLAALLNQLEGVTVIPETNFLPRLVVSRSAARAWSDGQVLEYLKKEPHFVELKLSDSELLDAAKSSGDADVARRWTEAVVDNFTSGKEPRVVVIKCGEALQYMPEIQLLYPDSLFLHIVRDGRAVCSSKLKSTTSWQRKFSSSVISNATHWKKRMRLANQFHGNLISVRYEDLVLKQDETMSGLADSLGLSLEDRRLVKSVGEYIGSIGGRQKHLHNNVGKPNSGLIDQWKSALTPFQVMYFQSACKAELEGFGYTMEVPAVSHFRRVLAYPAWVLWQHVRLVFQKLTNGFHLLREGRLNEKLRSRLGT